MPRKRPNGPHPMDVHVGVRLRLRRKLMGLSQSALGSKINLTFQQIQKYERGANRIGAGRLHDLAEILDVPVSFFYDGFDGAKPARPVMAVVSPETLVAAALIERIPDKEARRRLLALIKALAAGADDGEPS